MLSFNNRQTKPKRGVRKGYKDPAFHTALSRGYATITPSTCKEASSLHEFGPFYKGTGLTEFLGTSSLSYWKGKSVVFPFSIKNTIAWFLDIIPEEVKEEFKNVDSVFTALPSYVASFGTLKEFSKFREGFRGKVNPKFLKLDDQLWRLKLPINLSAPVKRDIFNAKLTRETHPGIVTRAVAYLKNKRLFKNSLRIKKKHVIHKSVMDVLRNWHNIGKGKFRNTCGTYMLGSREKIQVLDFLDEVKLRTVWIPETIDIIVGSTWLEHLKAHWGKRRLFKSEIWLGHADQHQRFYRRIELDKNFRYSYEFDGKVWEVGVVPEVIIHAFNIIESCFVSSEFTRNHIRFIMDTMVMKKIVLHNGNTFACNQGIPSGHAFTALVNSLCNWIIWTSTIKNCPHVPSEMRKDYEGAYQGDDVDIHTNVLLTDETINKIIEWMLVEFNYRASFSRKNKDKTIDKTGLKNSSFLKRVINAEGMLDTPVFDIWEKVLNGNDYSGLSRHPMTYLRRRANDLAIFDNANRARLALYYSYIREFPNLSSKVEKELYHLLFLSTNGFTNSVEDKWKAFSTIFNVKIGDLLSGVEKYNKYFSDLYKENYLRYDSSMEYVDYWKEREKSITISQILKNFSDSPALFEKDLFLIIHGKRKKKKKKYGKRDRVDFKISLW